MAFSHENLNVYKRSLAFNATVESWIGQWDPKHAIRDHLERAAGSIVENLAVASATYSAPKTRSLDYALASTLECAACLDLAGLKGLLGADGMGRGKRELVEILAMLMGLRRSWSTATRLTREDEAEYGSHCPRLFHHETLDVYRTALTVATRFAEADAGNRLPNPVFRRLDDLVTSMVLNIAEGNGRVSEADQRKFLTTAREAAIKLAARLDLHRVQGVFNPPLVATFKELLERVSAMLAVMSGEAQRSEGSRTRPGKKQEGYCQDRQSWAVESRRKGSVKLPTKRPERKATKFPTKSPERQATKLPTWSPTKSSERPATRFPAKFPTKSSERTATKFPTKFPTKSSERQATKSLIKRRSLRPQRIANRVCP